MSVIHHDFKKQSIMMLLLKEMNSCGTFEIDESKLKYIRNENNEYQYKRKSICNKLYRM